MVNPRRGAVDGDPAGGQGIARHIPFIAAYARATSVTGARQPMARIDWRTLSEGRRSAWAGWIASSLLVHAGFAALWTTTPISRRPQMDVIVIELAFAPPAAAAAMEEQAEPPPQTASERQPVPLAEPPAELPASPSEPLPPPPKPTSPPPPKAAPVKLRPPAGPPLGPRPPNSPPAEASTQAAEASPAAQAPVSASWRSDVAAWLQTHKSYPEAARLRGDQGSAAVRFTVSQNGTVTDVSLVRGTGSATLDEAVRTLLTDARLPPFPAAMTQNRITVTVQIDYALRR